MGTRWLAWVMAALLAAGWGRAAWAVKVADITRIGGQRSNVLTGLGLVVGLKGTGDGGEFKAAVNPLAEMLKKFADPVAARDLANVQNVALVSITATVPSNGVRDGDRIDVYVTSVGAASSLRGGRLFVTPMVGPLGGEEIFALAEGQVVIEDTTHPTVGVIKGGAVMETDLPAKVIENGRFTLILEEPAAGWTTASTIAKVINGAEGASGEMLAVALDTKSVVVTIPESERKHPDSFISRILQLPVPMQAAAIEARVKINEKTGTMVLTGDVEISPVVISHKGLTITTVNPPPTPTPRTPVSTERGVVGLDPANQGGAKLQDLINALDQLKVPAEDRITIIKELHKTGKLHAKLVLEGV